MKTKRMTVAALLTAIAIIIPTIMPVKVLLPPFTATLGSHVPIILAMFISPLAALFVSIGSAVGFLITLGPVVAIRAAMHVIFAVAGAVMIRKRMNIFLIIVVTLVLHTLSDMGIVYLIFMFMPDADILKGQAMSVVQYIIGIGTSIHHVVDFIIAWIIYIPISKVSHGLVENVTYKRN